MIGRTTCTLTAVLVLTACSAAVDTPAWYPPEPCRDCYQGEGVADDYRTARKRALGSLCEDIAVVVESTSTDERRHVLKQSRDAAGNEFEEMDFSELAVVVDKTRARCYFEGMPIKETREDIGGRSYVLLRLNIHDYRRYMATRTVGITVETGHPGIKGDSLRNSLAAHLRQRGYLVSEGFHYLASLALTPSLNETPAGFQGLKIGTAELAYTLKHLDKGREVESAHCPDLTSRAFTEANVLSGLEDEAVKCLGQRLQ